ncbi:MAG: serine hydrolase [Caldimonas sp.]
MEADRIGHALVAEAARLASRAGLQASDFALTLLLHRPEPATVPPLPTGFSYRGGVGFYPCSVVKLFLVVAAQLALDAGRLTPHDELDRAMRDMIRWSSNTATNYVIDLLSGTTGDTLLGDAEMRDWVDARNRINRFYAELRPSLCADVNLAQKLMDDDRYGREKMFVQWGGANNHNRLSSDAAAWLLADVMCGRAVLPSSSERIAGLLHRPLTDDFVSIQAAQVKGYLGGGLPGGTQLWSKAGRTLWTGDPLASYRRHDAVHVKLAAGQRFTLAVFTQGQAIAVDDEFLPRVGKLACELVADT